MSRGETDKSPLDQLKDIIVGPLGQGLDRVPAEGMVVGNRDGVILAAGGSSNERTYRATADLAELDLPWERATLAWNDSGSPPDLYVEPATGEAPVGPRAAHLASYITNRAIDTFAPPWLR